MRKNKIDDTKLIIIKSLAKLWNFIDVIIKNANTFSSKITVTNTKIQTKNLFKNSYNFKKIYTIFLFE